MSDIKFVGNDVHIEGSVLKCTTFDIELDNSGRRRSTAGKRRAFVHNFQDGLTLNWAGDYPGGITLNGQVNVGHLAGTHLRLSHHDLMLDNPGRRSAATGSRRALVHDTQDGLTINFNQDYPGGVTLRGEVKAPQSITTPRINGSILRLGHHTLHLSHEPRRSNTISNRRALVHDTNDGLTINFAQDYPGGVTIRGPVRVPGSLMVGNLDVLDVINTLVTEIADLKHRLQALEG